MPSVSRLLSSSKRIAVRLFRCKPRSTLPFPKHTRLKETPETQSLPAADPPHEAPKEGRPAIPGLMTLYLRCFFQHAGYKAIGASALMVISGLLEGSGLLILFP